MGEVKNIKCDVLVIGGGETGIRAAVEAKRKGAENVLLVTKGKYGSAGVMFSEITYGWDMQAATGQNDPTDNKGEHLKDIMNAAQGTCSEKMAAILTEEAPDRLHDLENLFDLEIYKKPDGTPRQVYGCFSTKDRGYQFTHPDEIKKKVAGSLEKYGVNMMDGIMVTELAVSGGRCGGALGLDASGTRYVFTANATIVACGGATGMFKHNFASPGMCGDGYALALNAGCKLANMEFMQFGLGLLEPKYRALFLDRLMYLQPDVEFTYDHHFPCSVSEMLTVHSKHFPFSTIDESALFDVAVFEETVKNGRGVAVDLSVIPLEKLEEIPVWGLYYNYFDADKNPYENKLFITTFAHACNGGVMINENSETGIEGLYAAGEMISGPHGANRLGGNMHAACQVFGTRAGANAAAYAAGNCVEAAAVDSSLPEERCSLTNKDYVGAKERIGEALWEKATVLRNEEGLKEALRVIDEEAGLLEQGVPADEYLWHYYELKSTVVAAAAIVASALERKETRGSHNRSDYPQTDEKSYLVTCSLKDGQVVTERIDSYPV